MRLKLTPEFFKTKEIGNKMGTEEDQKIKKILADNILKEKMLESYKYEFLRFVADDKENYAIMEKYQKEKIEEEIEKIIASITDLEILPAEETEKEYAKIKGKEEIIFRGLMSEDKLFSTFITRFEKLFSQWFEYVSLENKINGLKRIYEKILSTNLTEKTASGLKILFWGIVLEISTSKQNNDKMESPTCEFLQICQIIGI